MIKSITRIMTRSVVLAGMLGLGLHAAPQQMPLAPTHVAAATGKQTCDGSKVPACWAFQAVPDDTFDPGEIAFATTAATPLHADIAEALACHHADEVLLVAAVATPPLPSLRRSQPYTHSRPHP